MYRLTSSEPSFVGSTCVSRSDRPSFQSTSKVSICNLSPRPHLLSSRSSPILKTFCCSRLCLVQKLRRRQLSSRNTERFNEPFLQIVCGVYRRPPGRDGPTTGAEKEAEQELEPKEYWGSRVDREDLDLMDSIEDSWQPDYLEQKRISLKPERAFGAVFEMEGVLVETSKLHEESWHALAKEEQRNEERIFAGQRSRQVQPMTMMRNEQFIYETLGWSADPREIMALSARKEEIYCDLIASRGLEPLNGVRHCLELFNEAQIPCAVGALAPPTTLAAVLKSTGLSHYFSAVVSSHDFTRVKPSPHMYLIMANKLQRPPSKCAVFDHTPVAIEAARSVYMKCVMLTTTHPPYHLTGADLIFDNLNDLSIINFRKMFIY